MQYNDYDVEGTGWIDERVTVRDQDVWQKARESAEEPSFENILIELRFEALQDYLFVAYPEIEDYDHATNCAASYFLIKDEYGDMVKVSSYEEIEAIAEKLRFDLIPIDSLKSCPFCGKNAGIYMSESDYRKMIGGSPVDSDSGWLVICDASSKGERNGCGTVTGWGGTKERAREKWNRRAT